MKIIHTADLHIGSALSDFSRESRKVRKAELMDAFKRLVEYADANDIKKILLSGDIFDKDKVNKTDKDYFYQIIEANQELDFYYLKGNHDLNSAINKDDIPNLYLFNNEWCYYQFEDITIAGIELAGENQNTLFTTLNLDRNKYNIVMLHVDIKDLAMNKFKNKNIDYLALGHIHSYVCEKLDARGVYVYPGCLEGRGFDEVGTKGFVVIDTDSKSYEFVPFASRMVAEETIDITGTKTLYEATRLIEVRMKELPKGSIARSVVVGKVEYSTFDLESRLAPSLKSYFLDYEVKDKTTKVVKLSDYEHDISLRGEVVRTILAKGLDETQQNAILDDCLKLLNGEDIEL